jgi:predicted enzyme related to lactoylglutathione lyase
VTSPSSHYAPGVFCWAGLATSDPAGATAFYSSLFGWQNEELPAGDFGTYASLRRDGKEVAILYRQTREARAAGAAPHWTPFVSVEDADASALRARELGGLVLREPLDFLDAGRVVAVRDPTGGILSLWQPRAHAGAEFIGGVGALCWNELATDDVDRAKSFYAEFLGWEYQALPSGHATITSGGDRIGWMREHTSREEGATQAEWVPYFGVESAQDTRQNVVQSGGRTLATPTDSPIGCTALITDPQGATFALLELHASSS